MFLKTESFTRDYCLIQNPILVIKKKFKILYIEAAYQSNKSVPLKKFPLVLNVGFFASKIPQYDPILVILLQTVDISGATALCQQFMKKVQTLSCRVSQQTRYSSEHYLWPYKLLLLVCKFTRVKGTEGAPLCHTTSHLHLQHERLTSKSTVFFSVQIALFWILVTIGCYLLFAYHNVVADTLCFSFSSG